ncbi:MAG: polysaccharide deacetylase family protein [bacterium]
MLDRVWRELARYRDPRQLLDDLKTLRGPVQRTPEVFIRLFPDALWGHPDREQGPLLLTFDDGPVAEITPLVLDSLKRHHVKAVFFLRGDRIEGQEKVIARMRREGHSIGYHGASHQAWWFLTRFRRSIEMNPAILPLSKGSPFAGDTPLLLRPPFGRFDYAAVASAAELNARLILFSLVVGDWKEGVQASQISERLLKHAKPGDIIVLHDGGVNGHLLPRVLDTVLPLWKHAGLRLGSIREFLAGRAA